MTFHAARFAVLVFAAVSCGLQAEDSAPSPLDRVADQVAADYAVRLEQATHELEAARSRITAEKEPQLKRIQELETAIVARQAEVAALHEAQAGAETRDRQLQKENQALNRQVGYVQNLAHELARTMRAGYAPGEDSAQLQHATEGLDTREADGAVAAAEIVDLALERVHARLGGHAATGKAVESGSGRATEGTFAFIGPSTVFVARDGSLAGVVVARDGSPYPTVHRIPRWSAKDALPLAEGREANALLDPSGGKALQLHQNTGSYREHIGRGGIMALVIIATGAAALVLALHKLWEVRTLQLDSPPAMKAALVKLATANSEEAEAIADSLRGLTRGLFLAGARQFTRSKDVIEEQLYAFTLGQRLHYEKRLPLLAVIATAAPLMGLLGTVMGMVKTFALITVFGTGNAAKLSSGISEILITTELGLAVAIPALVVHGFLSHRIQKKLSQLERHAVEFLAAVSRARDQSNEFAGATT